MPYTINFSDQTKDPIVVEDNTVEDTRSSLDIPGKNTTGYGTIVGQNFIKLLENFASSTPPRTPIEGQIWFDSNSKRLLVSDSTADANATNNNWRPASGVYTQDTEPLNALIGDIWVDTDTKRLYLHTGSTWILVGPNFSEGLSTGASPSTIIGTDNQSYTVLVLEIEGKPAFIVSANSFIPKAAINGFASIVPGLNISTANLTGQGYLTVNGVVENAKALLVGSTGVPAANFLRADQASTTNFLFKVKNDNGLRVGSADSASLTVEANNATITNRIEGAAIDFKINDGSYTTAMRINGAKNVGIQKLNPDYPLDVAGTIRAESDVIAEGTIDSTGTNSGSLRTLGGLGVSKSANIGQNLKVFGNTTVVGNILPDGITNNIGASNNKFDNVYSDKFHGTFYGQLEGSLTGNLNGKATQLASATTFRLAGDITSQDILFDGRTGTSTKTFNTTVDPSFINSKDLAPDEILFQNDEFLINRTVGNAGLLKVSKGALLKSIPQLPTGSVLPYAGTTTPDARLYGGYWLLCDGSTYNITDYSDLYDVIGTAYNPSAAAGTFSVPDMRSRGPIGIDNMGGTAANRIDSEADAVGYTGGTSTVNITKSQIPEHQHDLINDANKKPYYAVRQSEEAATGGSTAWKSGTGANTSAVATTGGILNYDAAGQQPLNIMNPFVAMNYIIWTGKEI